jgi:hypothetical protein
MSNASDPAGTANTAEQVRALVPEHSNIALVIAVPLTVTARDCSVAGT